MSFENILFNYFTLDLNAKNDFLEVICQKASELCPAVTVPRVDHQYENCMIFFKQFEDLIASEQYRETITENNSNLCGKILKVKEPIYMCTDCATDTTCVLCRSCFINSEHINHNYELHSSGGGSCDCGDTEAWKAYPNCKLHLLSPDNSEISFSDKFDIDTATKSIPNIVKIRFLTLAKIICENFQRFAMRPLHKADFEERSQEFQHEAKEIKEITKTDPSKEIALVLYNNEFHNFDQVITLFKRCLQCSADEAMSFANIVDRDGRCISFVTNKESSVKNKQIDLMNRSKNVTSMELLTKMQYTQFLSLQNFCIYWLRWLYEFIDRYPKLRVILCYNLLLDQPICIDNKIFPKLNLIDNIFCHYNSLWKIGRNACHHFLMTVIFKSLYFKKLFAVEVVKNYEVMIDHFKVDDHNPEDGLVSIDCQLFTVISIGRILVEENNALTVLLKTVYDVIKNNSQTLTDHDDIYQFHKADDSIHRKFDEFERQMRTFLHLRFLLRSLLSSITGIGENGDKILAHHDKVDSQFSPRLVDNLSQYYALFVDLLALIQDINLIERVTNFHVEYEPQWRNGIVLMFDMIENITITNSIVVLNQECTIRAFNKLTEVFTKRIVEINGERREFSFSKYSCTIIKNNWPTTYISIIKPLPRLFAPLLQYKYCRELLNEELIHYLCDQALQIVVFASQQAGNMWIRNGSVPYILCQQMKSLVLKSEMFDRDLQLLQELAICISPRDFLLKAIQKFDLSEYLNKEDIPSSDRKAVLQRAEDFLLLMIQTLFYRHRVNVGKGIDTEAIIKYMIFHVLCIKPMPHSKVVKKLPGFIMKIYKSKFMELLEEVSDQTKLSQMIIFNPKQSLIKDLYDRFSPYYTVQDRNASEQTVKKIMQRDQVAAGSTSISATTNPAANSIFIEPGIPIDLCYEFQALTRYLSDECFVEIIKRYMAIITGNSDNYSTTNNTDNWNNMIVELLFHLIGMCLHEDFKILLSGRYPKEQLFVEACEKYYQEVSLLKCLERFTQKTSNDVLISTKWLIRKWNEVVHLSKSEKPCEALLELNKSEQTEEKARDDSQQKLEMAKRRRDLLLNKMKEKQKSYINKCSVNDITYVDADCQRNLNETDVSNEDFVCLLCQESISKDPNRPIVALGGAWRSNVLQDKSDTLDHQSHLLLSSSGSLSLEYMIKTTGAQWSPDVTSNKAMFDNNNIIDLGTSDMESEIVDKIHNTDLSEQQRNMLTEWLLDNGKFKDQVEHKQPYSIIPMLDHSDETFITTCGHMMHYDCKAHYLADRIPEKQTIARTKGVLYSHVHNRCPLCKCVCNIDIPVINSSEFSDTHFQPKLNFDQWTNEFKNWTPLVQYIKPAPMRSSLISSFKQKMASFFTMNPIEGDAKQESLLLSLPSQMKMALTYAPLRMKKEVYAELMKMWTSLYQSNAANLIESSYALAYTITIWQKTLSKDNKSLLTDMSERHTIGLTYLIRAICTAHQSIGHHLNSTNLREESSASSASLSGNDSIKDIHDNCLVYLLYLQTLIFGQHADKLPLIDLLKQFFHKSTDSLICRIDFFYLLCSLIFLQYQFQNYSSCAGVSSDDCVFQDRAQYSFYCAQMIFQLVSVQVLITLNPNHIHNAVNNNIDLAFDQLTEDSTIWTKETINQLIQLRNRLMQHCSNSIVELSDKELVVGFAQSIITFLRCSSFLFNAIKLVKIPKLFSNSYSEMNQLMELLHLQVPSNSLPSYAESWLTPNLSPVYLNPSLPPKLIDLPQNFTDVITQCMENGCSLNRKSLSNVFELALCLICGETLCLSGYCCREQPDDMSQSTPHILSNGLSAFNSGAQIHARNKHKGYSLYLGTRTSKIIVLFYRARWILQIDPIYLDKFGESDPELKRGNPLFLDRDAYKRLERRWLEHSLGSVIEGPVYFDPDFFV